MYSIGYMTTILYLASLTLFMYAAFDPNFLVTGSILGSFFFLAATVILGLMIMKRRMTEFKH